MTSQLKTIIITVIDNNGGSVSGTECLAEQVNALHIKSWLLRLAQRLEAEGEINIIRSKGGRTRRTVYKRNRNSAGQARKVRQ